MRFFTIWTLKGLSLKERLSRTKEWGALKIAHKLPKIIKYWTCIEVATGVVRGDQHPETVTIGQMLRKLRPEDG